MENSPVQDDPEIGEQARSGVRRGRQGRCLIRAYLSKVSGRSLPQITRLIRQYRQGGQMQVQAVRQAQARISPRRPPTP